MWPEPSEEEGRSPIPCPSLLLGKQSPPLQPTFSHQYPPPEAPATAGGVLRDPPVPPPPPKRSVTKSLGQGVGSRQPTALLSPVVGNAAGMLWDPKGSAPGSGDSWKLSRPLGSPGGGRFRPQGLRAIPECAQGLGASRSHVQGVFLKYRCQRRLRRAWTAPSSRRLGTSPESGRRSLARGPGQCQAAPSPGELLGPQGCYGARPSSVAASNRCEVQVY